MASATNQYIQQVLHHQEAPPAIAARFFYSSTLTIDDRLSPLPPPATTTSAPVRRPPHPFSEYDNAALDKVWLDLRGRILRYSEERGEKDRTATLDDVKKQHKGKGKKDNLMVGMAGRKPSKSQAETENSSDLDMNVGSSDGPALPADVEIPDTTGNPFVRAPSRNKVTGVVSSASRDSSRNTRPAPHHMVDSYTWEDRTGLLALDHGQESKPVATKTPGPSAKVAVGVSRLHHVAMPDLQMEPIYWRPVNDIAPVVRATWFYRDNMLPVETNVANMLEAGYIELRPWSETWKDELNSAIDVGAAGEEKILHRLWPTSAATRRDSIRPGTARSDMVEVMSTMTKEADTPQKEQERAVEAACDIIDISTGIDGPDNKASGTTTYGYNGTTRMYALAGVIYANATEAHILKPNLQPSTYYGRRPLANYIRKGRKLGIPVVRGFDQSAWDKLYPTKKSSRMAKAQDGVSSSQSGMPPERRAKQDAELARSERPQVTDLVFVIHGIGQKLSERMESFHFTHAINAFRRELNVELGTDTVKAQLRSDMGGIMVLPVSVLLSDLLVKRC